jgi:hypothetical protein
MTTPCVDCLAGGSYRSVPAALCTKWFHAAGETELGAARALRDAHATNRLDAHVLDLALYELGNVLVRSLRWTADDVADQLEGVPLVSADRALLAAGLAESPTAAAERLGLGID